MKIIVLSVLLAASPAWGIVYMWSDSVGTAHYANKEYDIPARYKAKAKALYHEATDTAANQPANANGQASPVVQSPQADQQPNSYGRPKEFTTVTAPQSSNIPPRRGAGKNRIIRGRSAEEE